MKNLKKLFFIAVIVTILASSFVLPVFANAPMPADHLTVVLSNLPDDAVYVDLLVKINQDDPNFVDFQSNNYSDSVSKSSEIVSYSDGSFYSFTFHYKNSKSNIKIEHYYDDLYYVDFCNGLNYQDYLTQYESLRNHYRDVKVALLDKDFNIIVVSESIQLPKENNAFVFDGKICFDFNTNSLDFDTRINPYFVVFGGFFSILIMLMSIGTETVISLLFGFRGRQTLTILIVNICSQIIMRLLYLVLPFTYLIETIILEVCVYTAEFFIYKKYFKGTSVIKLVGYTLTANTLSLLLGIFLDCYILI
ncbi:MAG: hypothetical protein IKT44_04460 [Clostridia bacterium]|nr:hypothetical protein [Clostridia bacterium]